MNLLAENVVALIHGFGIEFTGDQLSSNVTF